MTNKKMAKRELEASLQQIVRGVSEAFSDKASQLLLSAAP